MKYYDKVALLSPVSSLFEVDLEKFGGFNGFYCYSVVDVNYPRNSAKTGEFWVTELTAELVISNYLNNL